VYWAEFHSCTHPLPSPALLPHRCATGGTRRRPCRSGSAGRGSASPLASTCSLYVAWRCCYICVLPSYVCVCSMVRAAFTSTAPMQQSKQARGGHTRGADLKQEGVRQESKSTISGLATACLRVQQYACVCAHECALYACECVHLQASPFIKGRGCQQATTASLAVVCMCSSW
jgi:hypothetical protein